MALLMGVLSTVLECVHDYSVEILHFTVPVLLFAVLMRRRLGADRKPPHAPKGSEIVSTPVCKLPDADGGTEAEPRASICADQLDEAIDSLLSMECTSIDSWKQLLVLASCQQGLKSVRLALRGHRGKGQVDTVTYSNAIHACLLLRRCEDACTLLDDMRGAGMVPSVDTFNAVLIQMVGDELQKSKVWDICADMVKVGVAPNHVTGSEVLKMLGKNSSEEDIHQTMGFVNSIGESANETLASSVLEAFMRIGASSRVAEALGRLQNDESFEPVSSSTFSTLIKAYTFVGDVKGALRYWQELRAALCPIHDVTISCMVEALVCSGDVEGAYRLVTELRIARGISFKPAVFGHLLRGYGRQHRTEKVWAVFQEMLDSKVKPDISTMNTMIDVCTRIGEMPKVPKLLDVMRKFSLSPDLSTYTIMIKGHCQGGNLQRALAVYNDMKRTAGIRCDEVVYNTLLDGCLAAGLLHESRLILQEMAQAGHEVPSAALARVVRMCGRDQKVGQAFDLVAQLTTSPPESVLVALVQVSIAANDAKAASAAIQQMRRPGFQAAPETHQSIVIAAISHGMLEVVEEMIYDIFGLRDPQRPSAQRHRALDAFLSRLIRELRAQGHFQFAKRFSDELRVGGWWAPIAKTRGPPPQAKG